VKDPEAEQEAGTVPVETGFRACELREVPYRKAATTPERAAAKPIGFIAQRLCLNPQSMFSSKIKGKQVWSLVLAIALGDRGNG